MTPSPNAGTSRKAMPQMPASTPLLAPSLLAGDHAMLAQSAATIVDAGLKWAHVDIMDGHFVPNLTFGPQLLKDLRQHVPGLFYDVHLMLDEPGNYTEAFAKAGADLISIHIEPSFDHAGELQHIRALGARCGIVLNPDTPVEALLPVLSLADLVLVMTVQPGYGGQSFRSAMLSKIRTLTKWRGEKSLNYLIEVDGGIDLYTGAACIEAGADVLVSGTAFFHATDKQRFALDVTGHKPV
jgi:ribulose-phosphate 3-epimerase